MHLCMDGELELGWVGLDWIGLFGASCKSQGSTGLG
jgi:hypothetical protein